MIKIIFDKDNSRFDELSLMLDNQKIQYSVVDDIIELNDPDHFGLHELTLSIAEGSRLEIKDVVINGSSVRQGLYFGFLKDNDVIHQPSTALWSTSQIWYFRFGTPVSHWLTLLHQKFRSGDLGSDLFKKFDIYWPEKLKFPDYLPIVNDHFEFDFDFLVLEKTNRSKKDLPYVVIEDFPDPPSNVVTELYENLDYIKENQATLQQHQYNSIENSNFTKNESWMVAYLYRSESADPLLDRNRLPEIFKFVDSLDLDINFAFIGILPPKQYVVIHRDFSPKTSSLPEKYQGCTQLYIPLDWPDGPCYMKFSNIGLLPPAVCVINNQKYVHGLINDTDHPRIALGIGCDIVRAREKFGLDITN